jgi:hypothetical protein
MASKEGRSLAQLLGEIKWAEPIVPAAPDAAWEAELARRGAQVFEIDRRIAPSHWLREAAFGATSYQPSEIPERQRAEGLPELRFGIGIHGGEVVAGVIGTAGLANFSVTGVPINVASRVEGLTSKHQVDLLVTEDIRRVVGDEFVVRPMPAIEVEGKAEPILTFYVESAARQ